RPTMTAGGIAQLTGPELRDRLAAGLRVQLGPYTVAIHSNDPALTAQLAACYPDYALAGDDAFAHCSIAAMLERGWRRRRAHGMVRLDDGSPFSDYEPGEGLPYLEWGINWCIATRCHFFLMLHAAVLARDGQALIMPGLPGAGKSTLCTYLAHNGWRQ